MEILKWLQEWYKLNCDGNWEHMFGIKIYNVDNPGWSIEIDLADTDLEEKPFKDIEYDNSNVDWMFCYVKEEKFYGSGGPDKLIEIIEIFKSWAEQK